MEGQLYLLEMLVEKIEFYANLKSVPQKKQINVFAVFDNIAHMEIRSESPGEAQEGGNKRLIDFNAGRSCLFPCQTKTLINALQNWPIEISVYEKGNSHPIGTCSFPWNPDFIDMVQCSEESEGYITPMSIHQLLKFHQNSEPVGELRVFVRLSCFGKSIQTHFQVMPSKEGGREYIFKDTNAATTFQCKRYGMTGTSSDTIPVAPIYNIVDTRLGQTARLQNVPNSDVESWMQIYNDATQSLMSLKPTEFKAIDAQESIFSTFSEQTDIVSLRDRPDERKYFDIVKNAPMKIEGESIKMGSSEEICNEKTSEETEDPLEGELTADRINRLLCKNKDCPGAIKFKEFGIGPLATTKCLGTVYEPDTATPNTTYGLSHTYGTLDNYGPYGLFSKPKRPEQPFIPNKVPSNITIESCSHKVCDKHKHLLQRKAEMNTDRPNACVPECIQNSKKPLRLKGGSPVKEDGFSRSKSLFFQCHTKVYHFDQILKEYAEDAVCCCFFNRPLRLRGGGQLTLDDLTRPKSPLFECRVIMDQFDKILQEYKKALGPCGNLCPYSPNLMEIPCRRDCCHEGAEDKVDLISCIDLECPFLPNVGVKKEPGDVDVSKSDCAELNCPFHKSTPKKINKKKHLQNACGNLLCPYTKYKTGLVDADADLELQYLPPAISGKCGHPKCPYPVQPDLPPIHWDCPDPLPKGPCKNPECPFLPPDLKCLKILAPKGPCGSPTCPYVTPDPCSSPQCPFRPQPCPFAQQGQNAGSCGDHSRGDEDSCLEVDCPFAKRKTCRNPTCPFSETSAASPCGNPRFTKMDKGDTGSDCGSPECPFGKRNKMTPCKNPNCPFSMNEGSIDLSIESGCPLCPQKRICDNDACQNPDCPSKKNVGNPPCPNAQPFCPYCRAVCPSSQPVCPYAMPVCVNPIPECPYASPSPCPYEKPICPYSLPICPPQPCVPAPPICEICKQCVTSDFDKDPCGIRKILPGTDEGNVPEEGKETEPDEFATEYISGDRPEGGVNLAPCKKSTCKSAGGTLICDICPCGEEGATGEGKGTEPGEFDTEYISGDRPEGGVDLAPCKKGTCKSTGGVLICDTCPCSGEAGGGAVCSSEGQLGKKQQQPFKKGRKTASDPGLSKKKISLKKLVMSKKWKSKYVYSVGDKYPGVKVGHRECVMPGFNVPPHMGWAWNIHTPCLSLKPRRGWRPGAVTKTIAKRIRDHRLAKGFPVQELPDFSEGKKKKKKHRDGVYESDSDSTVAPRPTLQIKKKEGCYFITMNPLKDPKTLADNENPYMECTPMQFKIIKNKNKVKMKTEEEDDYKTCYCSDEESIPSTSSSDSELDIEFTPPAGIIRPERLRKHKNVVHCDTQYNPNDCIVIKDKKKDKKAKGKKGKKGKGKKGKKKK